MARAVYISKTGNVAKRIHDLNPVKDYFLRERMIMMMITTVSTAPAPAKTKGRMGVLFGKWDAPGCRLVTGRHYGSGWRQGGLRGFTLRGGGRRDRARSKCHVGPMSQAEISADNSPEVICSIRLEASILALKGPGAVMVWEEVILP